MSQTKPGTIETIYRTLNATVDPVGFFNNLRHESKEAFLFESADMIKKYGEKSIGCVDPCLKVVIKDDQFSIYALNGTGQQFIRYVRDDFPFAKNRMITEGSISGVVEKDTRLKDEESRLKDVNMFDIPRKIAFKFRPKSKLGFPFGGLFGAISYDAIDYFEELPKQKKLHHGTPDMEFYFADKLFVMDHLKKKTYLIANLLVTDETSEDDRNLCRQTLDEYEQVFYQSGDYSYSDKANPGVVTSSLSDKQYGRLVNKVKSHINDGDIFQCVLSRTFKTGLSGKPLDAYARLKNINPGPYMFYFQNSDYTLLGSSPETCLKVDKGRLEIKPIAGTLPRGSNDELDSRYEVELLLNEKELAEHCMLLDLARNDVAKVSLPATRTTPQILKVEKFSHVQHLVSSVQGTLRPDLDVLHAYVATMNMGTLTGAPKIKAMELIRKYEKEKREFYGGAVCYLTPDGDFDSCIVIRAITVKDDVAFVRAGAGIVYDSDPAKEADETRRKASACLAALGVKE